MLQLRLQPWHDCATVSVAHCGVSVCQCAHAGLGPRRSGCGTATLATVSFGCAVTSIAILNDGQAIAGVCAGVSGLAVVPVNNSSSNTGATVSSVVSCDDVKTMGDFNGDGTDDVLCNGTRVVLVSSVAPESHGALGIVRLALPATPPDPGPAAGSAAARMVAPIGDEDGDGIPDVSVAAADGIRIVTLHRDGSTRAGALVLGAASAIGASSYVAGLGDVNGDGVGDLLVVVGGKVPIVANVSCPQCARAFATDAGAQPGIGVGDTLAIQFPCAVAGTRVSVNASEAAAYVRISSPLGALVSGLWQTSSSLVLTIVNAAGQLSAATRIGALTVTSMACGGGAVYSVAGTWGAFTAPPAILSAVAENTGGQAGLGIGDSVLVTMNIDTDAASVIHPNVSLGTTSATWVDARTWRIMIHDASIAAAPWVTRVGAALLLGTVWSADLTSPRGPASAVLGGSWGNFPPPRLVSAVANDTASVAGMSDGDTIMVEFDMDTSTPPANALLQFVPSIGAYRAAWVNRRAVLVTLVDTASAGATADTRVGTLRVRIVGDLRSVDLSSPPCTNSTIVYGTWGNAVVGIINGVGGSSAAQRLATAGGQSVTLTLAASLGAGGDPVSATYSNGAFRFLAASCAIVPTGEAVACTTAAGVGAGFVWSVTIWGVTLPLSSAVTGYAAPVITSVQILVGMGPGTTVGGQLVQIGGSSFGPRALDAVSRVFFYPRGFTSVVFYPSNCSVITDDSLITCDMPPCAGSNFVFSMQIGGQNTTDVALPMLSPSISAVIAAPLPSMGGLLLRVVGMYFGVSISTEPPVVSYGPAASSLIFAASNCTVVVPQEEIHCLSAAGYGANLVWQVSVLGIPSEVFTSNVSYINPHVTSVVLGTVPVSTMGGAITLDGFGFAAAYTAVVGATVDGAAAGTTAVTYTSVTVSVPPGVGAQHTLVILVGGVASNPVAFGYGPPVVTQVLPIAGGVSFWDVRLQGSNFGRSTSAVNVTIGGVVCVLTAPASDSSIVCRTTVLQGGPTNVTVSGQAAAGSVPPFAPESSAPSPVLSGWAPAAAAAASGVVGLPLTGGGVIRFTGSGLGGAFPTYGVLLQTGAAWNAAVDCPRAAALQNVSLASDFCVGAPVWTATSVVCTLPPSRRALVYIVAVDLWFGSVCYPSNPTPISVRYGAPTVSSILPALLDTTGGNRLQITGVGFPEDTVVTIGGGALCGDASVINSSFILCTTPPGVGANMSVSLNSSAYPTGVVQHVHVSYLPPTLISVSPASAPCAGGGTQQLMLTGTQLGHLGPGGISVRLGAFLCTVVSVDASGRSANLTAPAGVGRLLDVIVVVGAQSAVLPGAFSFEAPVVAGIGGASSYVNAATGGTLTLTGSNFVPLTVNVSTMSVTIGSTVCASVTRVSDAVLTCTSPPMLITSSAMLVVTIEGQASAPLAVRVWCPPSFFGLNEGDTCQPCPTGASCAGQNYAPVPIAGYARVSVSTFVACVPPESCVAVAPVAPGTANDDQLLNNCAVGYDGAQCRSCSVSYYRNGLNCVPCPSLTKVYLAAFIVAVVVIGAFAGWMQKKQFNLQGITIGIDLLQTLAMFKSFAFQWPGAIDAMLSATTVSTFSIDIVSPECTISFTYAQKWAILQAFPPIMAVILSLGIIMSVFATSLLQCCRCRGRAELCSSYVWTVAWDGIVGGVFALVYYSYFMLVRQSFDIFACSENADGTYSLNSDPSSACWTPGSVQQQLMPYAALSLLVYGLGIPAMFLLVLYRNRDAVRRDQTLWLIGRGTRRLDNPDFSVRQRYARLYQDYRVEHPWWRLVLLSRKLVLVAVTVLARNNSMFQASLCLAALAVAYALHAKHHPFVSAAAQKDALEAAALTPKLLSGGTPTAAESAKEKLINFNSMETTLLSACVAIILQGMVFQSAEFPVGSAAYIALTFTTAAVMISALLLFSWNLAKEIRRTCGCCRPAGARGQATAAAGTPTTAQSAALLEQPPQRARRGVAFLGYGQLAHGYSKGRSRADRALEAAAMAASGPGGPGTDSKDAPGRVTVFTPNPMSSAAQNWAAQTQHRTTSAGAGVQSAHAAAAVAPVPGPAPRGGHGVGVPGDATSERTSWSTEAHHAAAAAAVPHATTAAAAVVTAADAPGDVAVGPGVSARPFETRRTPDTPQQLALEPAPALQQLPPGWSVVVSASGDEYYANIALGLSSWTIPDGEAAAAVEGGAVDAAAGTAAPPGGAPTVTAEAATPSAAAVAAAAAVTVSGPGAEDRGGRSLSADMSQPLRQPAEAGASDASQQPLPEGWAPRFSKSKQCYYYYHAQTGATSWSVPAHVESDTSARPALGTGAAAAQESGGRAHLLRALPEGWSAHTTTGDDGFASGIPYYVNTDTGETTWTMPGQAGSRT